VTRGPVAEISLSAIAQNLRTVQRIVKNRPVLAVVKADAYGHGAVEVSKRLLKEGISSLAVAFTGEARELRDAGINIPILVLFDRGDVRDYFDFNLTPVVYSMHTASSLSNEAIKRETSIKIHVKVDTGMGRLGLCGDNALDDLIKISEMPGLEVTGLLSHFSEADLSDRSYALSQLERFDAVQSAISQKLKRKIFSHIANSAAVLSLETSYLDAVRPGLMLYGYSPLNQNLHIPLPSSNSPKGDKGGFESVGLGGMTSKIDLIAAMKVSTRILCIRNMPSGTPISYGRTFTTKRPSTIGVIALGYADGYPRSFSNNSEVLVKGKRAPVVGRVCMDLMMVDLTDVGGAEESDEVVILGGQGNETITADELALKANTISYEILTTLGSRSKRTYVETH
jgi:alanine racemase